MNDFKVMKCTSWMISGFSPRRYPRPCKKCEYSVTKSHTKSQQILKKCGFCLVATGGCPGLMAGRQSIKKSLYSVVTFCARVIRDMNLLSQYQQGECLSISRRRTGEKQLIMMPAGGYRVVIKAASLTPPEALHKASPAVRYRVTGSAIDR